MATQLFFRVAVSDYGTGNNDAKLDGTASGWQSRLLSLTRGAVSNGHLANTVAGPTNGVESVASSLPIVWYSPPLDADVTISGSVTWNLRASESANNANTAINGRLEVIDGATGAITLIDQTARITELSTGETAANFAETPAAGVACKRGDRLRVRVFGDDAGTMGSGFTFTFFVDGPTAAASGDSYLTLTENLTFVSEPAGTQVFPTDTAILPAPSFSAYATLLSDFTGSDEDPLSEGGHWAKLNSADAASLRRVGNAVAGPNDTAALLRASYWTPGNFGPDVEAYATLAVVTNNQQAYDVYARVQQEGGSGTHDGYVARLNTSGDIELRLITNGSGSALGPAPFSITPAAGMKLGIRCHGSTIESWYQPSGGAWTLIGSVTDTTYPSAGKVGLGVNNNLSQAGRIDDFYAGTITSGLPYTTNREAWTSRGAGVQTDDTNTVAGWTAPIQVTDTAGGTVVDWFTRPLTAFTLGGAVRCNIRGLESNALANAAVRAEIARVAGDGTSPTVWAAGTFPTELGTTEAAQSFLVSGDDLAVTNGQRLRIRLYVDDFGQAAMGASQTVTTYYAGSAAATGDTYLTFTQTLTEYVPPVTYQPRNAAVSHQNPGVL